MTNRIEFLSSLNFLKDVDKPLLSEIARHLQDVTLSPGDILFHQGDIGDALYLIVEGYLDIEQNGTRIIARGPGEIVGEFALIDDNRRSARLRAVTDVHLLKWMREDFQSLLDQSQQLAFGILKIMTDKLREGSSGSADEPASDIPDSFKNHVDADKLVLPATDWTSETVLIYKSTAMHKLMDLVLRMEHGTSNVLLTGESGCGKEMIARAVHHFSPHREGPFIALNCGAVPENLAESELFGHERGAFTSAMSDKMGTVELAHRGTLFLDEIGELPKSLQVKLLRFLDDGYFTRVGGTRPLHMEVRILAATNRDLVQQVRDGAFRRDLYYRLNTIPIQIPPLRERPEDIPPLVEHFLENLSGPARQITPDLIAYLVTQPWHGNVRELRNVIERAAVIAQREQIQLAEMQSSVEIGAGLDEAIVSPEDHEMNLTQLSRQMSTHDAPLNLLELIEQVLVQTAMDQGHGNQSKAAALLGIDRKQIARRLKKYGNITSDETSAPSD